MSYLPNAKTYLSDLGRAPRILALGDSMFGALQPAHISTAIPGSISFVGGFGGEYQFSGAAAIASDIAYWGKAGNLFTDSRPGNWTLDRAVVGASNYPATGASCWIWSGDQSYTQTSLTVDVFPPDAGITDGLTFSFLMQTTALVPAIRGEIFLNGAHFAYLNPGSPADWMNAWYNSNSLPVRFKFIIPPGSYASGQKFTFQLIHADLQTGPVQSVYASEFQLNLGGNVQPYRETTGVPDVPAAAAYLGSPDKNMRTFWDMVGFMYRNPGGWANRQAGEYIEKALVDTAVLSIPRVCLFTGTPLRDTVNDVWLTGASDPSDVPNDFPGIVKRSANGQNCLFQSVIADFMGSGLAPHLLVSDQAHPTNAGDVRIANLFNNAYASVIDRVPARKTNGACVRFGTGIESGVWSDFFTTYSNYRFDFLSSGFAVSTTGFACRQSTAVNATATYSVTGRALALLYLLNNPGGEVGVSVDGLPEYTLTLGADPNFYMRSMPVGDASGPVLFTNGSHTVIIRVISGTVNLFGMVGL